MLEIIKALEHCDICRVVLGQQPWLSSTNTLQPAARAASRKQYRYRLAGLDAGIVAIEPKHHRLRPIVLIEFESCCLLAAA